MNLKPRSLLLASVLAIAACDSKPTAIIENGQMSLSIPTEIRQIAAFNTQTLVVQISINGQLMREVQLTAADEATTSVGVEPAAVVVARPIVNVPVDQDNELEVAWSVIIDGQKVLLADFSTVVLAGTTEYDVSIYNSDGAARFDADGDGRSNLSEAKDNRNMLSQYELEVPNRNAFGGVYGEVRSGGIDDDLSGDILELDEATSFSLRHDGTDLVVYVCGKDKTLHGDYPESSQYWHDDTVFMFIDGADSNSPGFYDGIDDFQVAFLRKTDEMIVSKGRDNQFCPSDPEEPNSNCISHQFLSPVINTACTYELTVRFPLAELNITTGTPVGFDIEISDDDNGGIRDDSAAWVGYKDQSNLDPRTFGTIILR